MPGLAVVQPASLPAPCFVWTRVVSVDLASASNLPSYLFWGFVHALSPEITSICLCLTYDTALFAPVLEELPLTIRAWHLGDPRGIILYWLFIQSIWGSACNISRCSEWFCFRLLSRGRIYIDHWLDFILFPQLMIHCPKI